MSRDPGTRRSFIEGALRIYMTRSLFHSSTSLKQRHAETGKLEDVLFHPFVLFTLCVDRIKQNTVSIVSGIFACVLRSFRFFAIVSTGMFRPSSHMSHPKLKDKTELKS